MTETGHIVVTVGVCVRNEEESLHETIDSLVGQDFDHKLMEIIFVDDGSEDNTSRIIQEYASSIDISCKVFHTKWFGLGSARQKVVNNASGDLVLFVDADTTLSKDYISKQVDAIKSHPNAGIAFGLFGFYPRNNWVATLENIDYVISRINQKRRITSNLFSTAGSILRLRAIREVGGFDTRIKGAHEDTDLVYRINRAGWISYVSEAQFYYKCKQTWHALWTQHFWYGYGLHFLLHKNKGQNALGSQSIDRIPISFLAYKLTKKKIVFLFPLNFVFKKVALIVGFLKANFDGYGHNV